MSKRQIKSQASSARAASSAFGGGFGASSSPAFGISSSQLSYVAEPPNLTSISDPNVVVYFRNLSKRDSTTKAKALEDLLAHVAALKTPLEEGLLEAWVRSMPCTYQTCSNKIVFADQDVSPYRDRQCQIRAP